MINYLLKILDNPNPIKAFLGLTVFIFYVGLAFMLGILGVVLVLYHVTKLLGVILPL